MYSVPEKKVHLSTIGKIRDKFLKQKVEINKPVMREGKREIEKETKKQIK